MKDPISYYFCNSKKILLNTFKSSEEFSVHFVHFNIYFNKNLQEKKKLLENILKMIELPVSRAGCNYFNVFLRVRANRKWMFNNM